MRERRMLRASRFYGELRTALRKHVLHASQQRPMLRFVFHGRQFSQFRQKFALAFVQFPRRLDSHLDVEIAFAMPVEYRHAFVPYAKRGSRLRTFGDSQLVFSLQRRNHNLGARGGLRKRNRNHAVEVVTLALKEGVLLDVQHNVQIAGRSAECARVTEARETNSRAVLHPRGHVRFDNAFAQQPAFAFALRARIGDHTARALAGWTSSSDAEEALLITHLASAVARPAANRSFTGRCAGAAASVAGLMAADVHLLLGAKNRFLKSKMQIFAKVGSALGPAATTAALAKRIAEAEDIAKNVAEILENSRIESGRTCAAAAHARMTKTVVQRTLLAVGKNCVCFRNLLELIFRVRIIRIAVGMVGHREFAVSALDFDVGGRTGDTEYLVIIAFCICGQKLPPLYLNQSVGETQAISYKVLRSAQRHGLRKRL